jgi:hypothetical protein
MYFRRKIFLLDQEQLKKITGHSSNASAVFNLIEQMDRVKATASCAPVKTMLGNEPRRNIVWENRFAIDQPEEKYITVDDCTNLRIELELCGDSQRFIDLL